MKQVGALLIVLLFIASAGMAQDRQPDAVRLSAWEEFLSGQKDEWIIRWSERNGLPRSIVGGNTDSYSGTPEEIAHAFLSEYRELFALSGESDKLRHHATREHRGIHHVTFDQYYRGVKIKGSEIKVHICENGQVDMVNGLFHTDIDVSVTPLLTASDALRIAASKLEIPPEREREEETGLVIYMAGDRYHLGWKVLIYTEMPLTDHKFIIDARDGEVLMIRDRLTGIAGSGRVYTSNPVHSSVSTQPLYHLSGDGTLNGTYVSVHSDGTSNAYSNQNNFTYSPTSHHFDEVNTYYHIDRFRKEFINELGNPRFERVRVIVNWSENPGNARYSRRSYRLYFGNGSGTDFNSFARDDMVIYHEYVHRVVHFLNSRLNSTVDERGAINEGVADYFAGAYTGRSLGGDYVFANIPERQRDMANPQIDSYARYLHDRFEEHPRGELQPHDGGEFFSAILWDLRNHPDTDPHYVDQLVYKAILRVSGFADFLEFRDAMHGADTREYGERISEVFSARGIVDRDVPFTVVINDSGDHRPGAYVTYTAETYGGVYPLDFHWESRYFCVADIDCGPNEGVWIYAGEGASVGFTFSPDIARRELRVRVVDAEQETAQSWGLQELSYSAKPFVLHGPYPNPFNRSTVLRWSLPGQAEITLKVFDVTGRCVSVLIEGTRAAGEYETRFDGTGLAGGVYIVRLTARENSGRIREETTKMMLLK